MKYNISILVSFLFYLSLYSQTLRVDKIEINYQEGSYPFSFAKTNETFYFTAQNKAFGRQLWMTDGTENGTQIVKVIHEDSYVNNLTVVNNVLFFTANDGINGLELWKTDGTESGTIMVKNINESTQNEYNSGPRNLFAFQNKLYFTAYTNANGWELWVSDGTANGTVLLKDINEGTNSSEPHSFVSFQNNLYFIASNNIYGKEIWKTDGTSNGTTLLKDIGPTQNNGVFGKLIVSGNYLYFAATADDYNKILDIKGYELWKTDGTENGTQIVKDIALGSQSSMSSLNGIDLNGSLIFTAYSAAVGNEVWITDGSSAGTVLLKNINNTNLNSISNNPLYVKFNNEIYFLADDEVHGIEIWKTDGTTSGTKILKNINTSPNYSSVNVYKFYSDEINNKLYFYGKNSNESQNTLWISDGTEIGTVNISSITVPDVYSPLDYFITFKNHTYFTGKNAQNGTELFKTDGSIENTKLFKDMNYNSSSSPSKLIDVNGTVFFRGTNEISYGNQLLKSDGTKEGTTLVKRIGSNSNIDDLSEMVIINNKLLFSAHNNVDGYEPWISDGTEEGTFMIKNIRPNGSSLRNYNDKQPFYSVNNIAYFFANDGQHGFEPWRSDGTEEGTFMLKDIRTYGNGTGHDQIGGSSWPKDFIEYQGSVYFIAFSTNGSEVWKTNGTQEGTEKVYEHPNIGRLLKINDKLIFTGYNDGGIFWESNGTAAGTNQINLLPYINLVNADKIYLNNELYFVTRLENISNRVGLYKTNGTESGTSLLYEGLNHPTLDNVIIKNLTECSGFIYFELEDYYSRGTPELWRTNGTITEKIDSNTGIYEISPICHQNNLIYKTDNPNTLKTILENKNEVTEFTIEITNNDSFSEYSHLYNLTSSGDYIFFSGRTDNSGEELFSMKIDTQVLATENFDANHQSLTKVKVYPNPSKDYIHILSNVSINRYALYTINGKLIYNKKAAPFFQKKIAINTLKNGVYILEMISNQTKITKKVVIDK